MTFTQLVCIQLLLMIVSHQVLTNPTIGESSDVILNSYRNVHPSHGYAYDSLDDAVADVDKYENIRQLIFNKLSKRRAKANLAGLWGVPTKFA